MGSSLARTVLQATGMNMLLRGLCAGGPGDLYRDDQFIREAQRRITEEEPGTQTLAGCSVCSHPEALGTLVYIREGAEAGRVPGRTEH